MSEDEAVASEVQLTNLHGSVRQFVIEFLKKTSDFGEILLDGATRTFNDAT